MASELKGSGDHRSHDLEKRMGRHVGDDEGLAAREHLLDLGVIREVDRQIAQLLVVARGDHIAESPRLAHEDDAHPIDLGHFGDALHDREQDAAEVEVRRQGPRELEDERARLAPSWPAPRQSRACAVARGSAPRARPP